MSTEPNSIRSRVVPSGWVPHRDAPTETLQEWAYELPKGYNLEDYRVVDKNSDGLAWAEPDLKPLESGPLPDRRRGTCFDVESTEMRSACVGAIGELLDAGAVVHEVRHQRSGYHADLVYADIDPEGVTERAAVTPSPGPLHNPLQRFKV